MRRRGAGGRVAASSSSSLSSSLRLGRDDRLPELLAGELKECVVECGGVGAEVGGGHLVVHQRGGDLLDQLPLTGDAHEVLLHGHVGDAGQDRKSTRLNSSHVA